MLFEIFLRANIWLIDLNTKAQSKGGIPREDQGSFVNQQQQQQQQISRY